MIVNKDSDQLKEELIPTGDTTSIEQIGGFLLKVDRDHKGRYLARDMNDSYRGWHYHIDDAIYNLDELEVLELFNKTIDEYYPKITVRKLSKKEIGLLQLGYINKVPDVCYEYSDEKVSYVWLCAFERLHICKQEEGKGVFTKANLKSIVKKMK